MKKIFITMCVALISICAVAQNNISWEANAGMNISSYNIEGYGSRVGFHLGVRGKMELPSVYNGVYANAGALISLKGASLDWGEYASGKSNAYYLEIPIHLGYQHKVNDDFSLFGEFGPYFAFGLFGKTSSSASEYDFDDNYNMNKTSVSEKHDTFDEFKRFDMGIGVRVGAELKQKYTIAVGYDFGLVNIWNIEESDDALNVISSVKNRNFYISLGYKF